MRISIISFSTYPNKSPRAMRTHELAKELAKEHDVTLLVLTGNFDYSEYQAETGVKVVSLGQLRFASFTPQSGVRLSFFGRVVKKVLGNLIEFPYIEMAFLTYKELAENNDTDLLITIANPHSIHWGAALAKHFKPSEFKNLTWVADCGDPYMGNPFHKKPFYFEYIEKFFCQKADYLAVPAKEAVKAYYPEFQPKIKVIPQGFEIDTTKVSKLTPNNQVVTFIYAGTFYEKFRDPRPLLDHLLTIDQPFEFIVHTRNIKMIEQYKKALGSRLTVEDYIPRQELIEKMRGCDFLINLENVGAVQVPSKLIDYILSERPVLSINTSNNEFIEPLDQFLQGDYSRALKLPEAAFYDIKNVAKKFVNLASQRMAFERR